MATTSRLTPFQHCWPWVPFVSLIHLPWLLLTILLLTLHLPVLLPLLAIPFLFPGGGDSEPSYGSEYGAPSSGYGTPSYSEPSYAAPASGYDAPDSGYEEPSSGYDAGRRKREVQLPSEARFLYSNSVAPRLGLQQEESADLSQSSSLLLSSASASAGPLDQAAALIRQSAHSGHL